MEWPEDVYGGMLGVRTDMVTQQGARHGGSAIEDGTNRSQPQQTRNMRKPRLRVPDSAACPFGLNQEIEISRANRVLKPVIGPHRIGLDTHEVQLTGLKLRKQPNLEY